MLTIARVSQRWKGMAYSPALWTSVSFRAAHGGIQVTNLEQFTQLIATRFTELKVCELATDLITPNVILFSFGF